MSLQSFLKSIEVGALTNLKWENISGGRAGIGKCPVASRQKLSARDTKPEWVGNRAMRTGLRVEVNTGGQVIRGRIVQAFVAQRGKLVRDAIVDG